MRPSYLQAYLQCEPRTLDKYQLLWQFYIKDGQPFHAAKVLGTLAELSECVLLDVSCCLFLSLLKIPLILIPTDRILYTCCRYAKSHPVSACGKHGSAISFLTDLEEKLEVSQVQLEIFHTLPRLQSQPSDPDLRRKSSYLSEGCSTSQNTDTNDL